MRNDFGDIEKGSLPTETIAERNRPVAAVARRLSIDFVLAFPQVPVTTDTYMQPPCVLPDFVIPDLPRMLRNNLNN